MMGQSTTPVARPAELPGRISSPEPHPLPYSPYPKARDVARHGFLSDKDSRGMFYVLRLA
jgi:hypothetical protein